VRPLRNRNTGVLRHHLVGLSAEAPLHVLAAVQHPRLSRVAADYAIFGTALTQWIGHAVNLDFQQQRFEADFRFNLVACAKTPNRLRCCGRSCRTRTPLGALRPRRPQLYAIMKPHQAADGVHSKLPQRRLFFHHSVTPPISPTRSSSRRVSGRRSVGSVQQALSFFVSLIVRGGWRAVSPSRRFEMASRMLRS